VGDQTKLSAKVLAACKSPANTLHLSLASVWEMQIKAQLGKLTLRLPLADILRDEQQATACKSRRSLSTTSLHSRNSHRFIAIRSTTYNPIQNSQPSQA
jgi:PIN domain nuclease of toxin-antitoxin system